MFKCPEMRKLRVCLGKHRMTVAGARSMRKRPVWALMIWWALCRQKCR